MNVKNGFSLGLLLGLGMMAVPAQAEMTSLAKLIGAGQSVSCTYEKTDSSGRQSGTIYVAGQRMRGEIQVVSSDGSYPMNILTEGGYQYMWGGPLGETQGMKMPLSAAGPHRAPHGKQSPDMNEEMDYQCKAWPVDASKFILPADVQFMDMASMVPASALASTAPAPSGGAMDMHTIQCSACDQAPEEDRTQCKQALGC